MSDAIDEVLEPTHVQAATLLAAGRSIDDVCAALSVGRATLYRWRQDPRFAAYMNQLLRTHADQAVCHSAQLLSLSISRVKAMMEDPNTPPEVQTRIAFRLLALYSRPSFIRYLTNLPDDPREVAEQDLYRANRAVGYDRPVNMDGSDYEIRMGYHEAALEAAKAFDKRYPNAQTTPITNPKPDPEPAVRQNDPK